MFHGPQPELKYTRLISIQQVNQESVMETNLFILGGKLMRTSDLVDDLSHAHHLTIMVTDWHTHDAVSLVSSDLVYLRVETLVLVNQIDKAKVLGFTTGSNNISEILMFI